jgi:hypothetical protein
MMLEERSEDRALIDECVARLKSIVPPMEHGALDSRLEELLNDANASPEEVIEILSDEFDPQQ